MSERPDDQPDAGIDRDIGQGYPEENQPGTGAGAHAQERSDAEAVPGAPDAPDTDSEQDSDPGQATGNPRAAGG